MLLIPEMLSVCFCFARTDWPIFVFSTVIIFVLSIFYCIFSLWLRQVGCALHPVMSGIWCFVQVHDFWRRQLRQGGICCSWACSDRSQGCRGAGQEWGSHRFKDSPWGFHSFCVFTYVCVYVCLLICWCDRVTQSHTSICARTDTLVKTCTQRHRQWEGFKEYFPSFIRLSASPATTLFLPSLNQ